jgi:hypothetical protein
MRVISTSPAEGTTIAPVSGNSLKACLPAELGMSAFGVSDAQMPRSSGTVELETPALPSEVCKQQEGSSPQLHDLSECPNQGEQQKKLKKQRACCEKQAHKKYGAVTRKGMKKR